MDQRNNQFQSGAGQPVPPQPQQPPPYSNQPPKGGPKTGLIIGIVAGVLVLGGIIFALVIFLTPGDDSDGMNAADRVGDSRMSVADELEADGLNEAEPLTFSPLSATEEAALTAILNSSYGECASEEDVVISKFRKDFSIQTCSTEFIEPGELIWHTNLIMEVVRGTNREELLEVQSTWHCGPGEINEVTAILGDKFIIAVRNYFTDATRDVTGDARKKILNEQTKTEYERLKAAGLKAELVNVCDLI